MALIVRYAKVDSSEVQIKETFLNFFPLHKKNADEITKCILDELQQNGLDIMMCRGQAYDNASTMAGIRAGVQCRIKQVNSKAIFIPYANHSLNLAGVYAVAFSEHSATFFAVVERVYSFFSASTQRWEVLLKHVPIVVKRVIDTRWNAHYEAVEVLQHYFLDVVSALNELNAGSVVEWLKHRTDNQHGLGSKPTYAILLCPWERHFTAFCPAWWS